MSSAAHLPDLPSIPETFKAYQYDEYGNTLDVIKLRHDVKQTPLEPNQVRIRVHCAALNPVDYGLIEKYGEHMLDKTPSREEPFTIGFDVAGTVVEAGSTMSRFCVGDAVYAMTPFSNFGTFAEYAVIDEKYVALKPRSLSFDAAAGVPLVALTSYQALVEHAQVKRGEKVLILGGSMATGMCGIQIAKAMGASVVTMTSPRNVFFVEALGADQVIDYTKETWSSVLEPHSIDIVYDCGIEPEAWNTTAQTILKKTTGRFVTLLPMKDRVGSEFGAKNHGQIVVYPSATHLEAIAKLIDDKKLVTPVDSVYAFDELFEAIKKSKSGHARGKLILKVRDD